MSIGRWDLSNRQETIVGAEKRAEEREDVPDPRSSLQTGVQTPTPRHRLIEGEMGTRQTSSVQSGLSVSWS